MAIQLTWVGLSVVVSADVGVVEEFPASPIVAEWSDWAPVGLTDDGLMVASGAATGGSDLLVWDAVRGPARVSQFVDGFAHAGFYSEVIAFSESGDFIASFAPTVDPTLPGSMLVHVDMHTRARTEVDLGGGVGGGPTAISDRGVLGGSVVLEEAGVATRHAAWWSDEHSAPTVLPGVGDSVGVFGINDQQRAVGVGTGPGAEQHLLAWDLADGTLVEFTSVFSGLPDNLSVVGFNDAGWVVLSRSGFGGWAYNVETGAARSLGSVAECRLNDRSQVACREVVGTDLGDRTLVFDLSSDVAPVAIDGLAPQTFNDRGQVAGVIDLGGADHMVLWDPIGGVIDLGLIGDSGMRVTALSNAGQGAGLYTSTFVPWIATMKYGPEAPGALRGVADAATASLEWSPPVWSGDGTLSGYRVYRNGSLIAETTAPTFRDALAAGTEATYAVTAVSEFGESAATNEVLVRTTPTAPLAGSPSANPTRPTAAAPRFTG